MSTRLVILGLLRERPYYGYELKQIIEEHMGDWTSIAFGSIYFALGKMSEEGLVEKVSTEQSGSRPSRTIYQITADGRNEFDHLLKETWSGFDRQYYDLDIALFFMNAMPRQALLGALNSRIQGIEQTLSHVHEHHQLEMKNAETPLVADAIFKHTIVHLEAELSWLKSVFKNLKNGAYD